MAIKITEFTILNKLLSTNINFNSYYNMKAKIFIPTDLNEIPLKSYQSFINTAENSNDEEFIKQKMLQIFCGLNLRNILDIDYNDVKRISIHITELFKKEPEFQKTFTLQNVEFGFIPDLENMSFGEYIDLSHNLSKIETLNKAMAVLYRPITEKKGEKYNIEKYESSATYSEVMKFAPLGVVLGAQVFFYHLINDLYKNTLRYLSTQMNSKQTKKILAQELNLPENGDGIKAFMQLLTDNLKSLELLPNYPYKTVLHGSLSKSKKKK